MGVTAHSTWKFNVPHSFGIHHAAAPDPYRGPYGRNDPDAGKKYAADVKQLIDFATSGQVAAFLAESIQGVGGVVVFPDGYLQHTYEHVRAAGGDLHRGRSAGGLLAAPARISGDSRPREWSPTL